MRFSDKVAVVTGASSGIGLETATALGREGARVALVSRGAEAGNAALQKLQAAGCTALFIPTDVSQAEQVKSMATRVAQEWGRLDILINNAGIYRQGSAADTSLEEWEHVLAVNLTGAFLCTQYALALIRQNGGGVIVNVASEAGLVGFRNQVAYNVSKAGMIALTRSCAVDLADLGIRVNCVCPGTTNTPLVQAGRKRYPEPAGTRRQPQQIRPLNRLGLPSEIASAILYLASDEAGFATGAVLAIDGGYTAQ